MRRHTDHSYLLRLWRDHAGAPLRATLIDPTRPDVRHHFTDLDALLSYLLAQHSAGAERAEGKRTPDGDRDQCTPGEDRS
jgi:hypothetical protein